MAGRGAWWLGGWAVAAPARTGLGAVGRPDQQGGWPGVELHAGLRRQLEISVLGQGNSLAGVGLPHRLRNNHQGAAGKQITCAQPGLAFSLRERHRSAMTAQ